MNSIGEQLRQAREAKGLSVHDVEQATHIRRAFLLAIEEGRLEELPEPIYARGFVRQYARLVGLDPEPLLEAFGRAIGPREVPVPTMLDEPLWQSARSGVRGLITALVVALVLLVAGWLVYNYAYLHQTPWPLNQLDLRVLGLGAPAPTATMAPAAAPQPAPTETPLPTATPVPATPAATALPATSTPTLRAPVTTTPAAGTATVGTPEATRSTTATVPASEGLPTEEGFAVRLVATGYTWVGVTVDDEQVFAGNLDAGDERSWTVENVFEITIGNAAAASIEVNGRPVGPLGGQGQVVTLRYTPETLPQ